MPGFDGTGPYGMGPMTGGGRGFCALPFPRPLPAQVRRKFTVPYAMPLGIPYYEVSSSLAKTFREEQLDYFKDLAMSMRKNLREVEERIHQLENKND
jgi:hypothetical protein